MNIGAKMIHISLEGGSTHERFLARQAIEFAVKELMPRKKYLSIDLNITNIEGDADGFHMFLDKGEHEIEIQKDLIEEDFVTAIFHEMVHVRQFERGHLKDKGVVKSWKGEEYIGIYDTVDTYMNLPWEEEAYRLQEEMYTKWIKTVA